MERNLVCSEALQGPDVDNQGDLCTYVCMYVYTYHDIMSQQSFHVKEVIKEPPIQLGACGGCWRLACV